MKIAICLSGQCRFFKESVKMLLNNLIEPYNCDVFCVFSKANNNISMEKHDFKKGDKLFNNENEIINILQSIFKKNLINYKIIEDTFYYVNSKQKIISFKDIKDVCIGCKSTAPCEYTNMKFHKNVSKENFNKIFKKCNELDMFVHPKTKKEYLCNELKKKYELENNFKYDIVLHTRIDLNIPTKFVFPNNILTNTVYLYRLWEAIYYGDSETIDKAVEKWNLTPRKNVNKYSLDIVPTLNKTIYNTFLYYNWTPAAVDTGLIMSWLSRNLSLYTFDKENKSVNTVGLRRQINGRRQSPKYNNFIKSDFYKNNKNKCINF